MGTRGLFGFYYKGCYYYVYNQYDSDSLEEYLREHIYHLLQKFTIEEIRVKFESLTFITGEEEITPEIKDKLAMFTDEKVDSYCSWYRLLRRNQRSFLNIFLSNHILLCNDQLDVDYIFIWNLDTNKYTFLGKEVDCNSIEFKNKFVFPETIPKDYQPPVLGKFFFYSSYDDYVETFNQKYNQYITKKRELENKCMEDKILLDELSKFPEFNNRYEETICYIKWKLQQNQILLEVLNFYM